MREVGWGGVESREGGVERKKKWLPWWRITGYVSCADSLECPGPAEGHWNLNVHKLISYKKIHKKIPLPCLQINICRERKSPLSHPRNLHYATRTWGSDHLTYIFVNQKALFWAFPENGPIQGLPKTFRGFSLKNLTLKAWVCILPVYWQFR